MGRRIKRARALKNPGSYRYIMRFCCIDIVQQIKGKDKEKCSTKGDMIWKSEQDLNGSYFYTLIYEDMTNVYNS